MKGSVTWTVLKAKGRFNKPPSMEASDEQAGHLPERSAPGSESASSAQHACTSHGVRTEHNGPDTEHNGPDMEPTQGVSVQTESVAPTLHRTQGDDDARGAAGVGPELPAALTTRQQGLNDPAIDQWEQELYDARDDDDDDDEDEEDDDDVELATEANVDLEVCDLFSDDGWVGAAASMSPIPPPLPDGDSPLASLLQLLTAIAADGNNVRAKIKMFRYGTELLRAIETTKSTIEEHETALRKVAQWDNIGIIIQRLRGTAGEMQRVVQQVQHARSRLLVKRNLHKQMLVLSQQLTSNCNLLLASLCYEMSQHPSVFTHDETEIQREIDAKIQVGDRLLLSYSTSVPVLVSANGCPSSVSAAYIVLASACATLAPKARVQAVEAYEWAADRGSAYAMLQLARLLLQDEKREVDEAREWLEKAAMQGSVDAMAELAVLLLVGAWQAEDAAGREQSDRKGEIRRVLEQLRRTAPEITQSFAVTASRRTCKQAGAAAAAAGRPAKVPRVTGRKRRPRVDLKRALTFLTMAARQGHVTAQTNLGVVHCSLGDYEEALHWYRAAVLQGSVEAMNLLGVCFHQGLGTEKDNAQAIRWFRIASDAGHGGACNNLGMLYEQQSFSNDEAAAACQRAARLEEAVRLYRMGANAQHPAAMANLGYLLCRQAMGVAAQLTKGGKATSHALRGGEDRELERAQAIMLEGVMWQRRGLELGKTDAGYRLGSLYEQGALLPPDTLVAWGYYKTAADAPGGHGPAALRVGDMLYSGHGVRKNRAEALKYYKQAAAAGVPDAYNALGIMLEEGKGVDKDLELAMRFYQRGAEMGNCDSAYNLGILLARRRSVDETMEQERLETALHYLALAHSLGHSTAVQNMAQLQVLLQHNWRPVPRAKTSAAVDQAWACVTDSTFKESTTTCISALQETSALSDWVNDTAAVSQQAPAF